MTQADLQKALRAADPAAVLVSPRILERVLRDELQLPTMYWNIPHRKSYVCNRQMLFRHAEQADLDLEPDQLLPDEVILLARPDAEEMSNLERRPLLLKYWRRLFHSRVHVALRGAVESGRMSQQVIRRRIEEIGRAEFEEVRHVLIQDNYLPPHAPDMATYIEFAAVYLELRYFAANLLPNYFPGIRDFGRIERMLGEDISPAELFAQTRLKDAPDPVLPADTRAEESQEAYWSLVRLAQTAALSGNTVKAAILRMRASRIAPAAQTVPTRREAENDIIRLSERLAAALELGDAEKTDWARYLTLLLDKADQGLHPMEARVLEELQQVCLDHEQEIFTLDLIEYLFSGGKRPIKRPLPSQRLVRIVGHLRSAVGKLSGVRISDTDRGHLTRLLQQAQHRTEIALQARFRPVLVTALEDVGLKPDSPLQRVAFTKMVDELLDHISNYSYLTFAELRDTISRNQLKLPDLTEPEHFIRGDPLIRLDRRLGALLDGVYRPGEFYVRWLERFTSLMFGTWWGRSFTRWVTLPLLISWLTLYVSGFMLTWLFSYASYPGIHTAGLVLMGPAHTSKKDVPHAATPTTGAESVAVTDGSTAEEELDPPHVSVWYHVTVLGGFTLLVVLLIQFDSFRRRCRRGLHALWYAIVGTFGVVNRLIPLAAIRRITSSWIFQLIYWYFIKPAGVTAIVYLLLPGLRPHLYGVGLTFLIASFLLNSRLGRSVSEAFEDSVFRLAQMIRGGLLPGIFRLISQSFKQVVESIEYMLFLVDEWLRFRSGDSRFSLVMRTLAGLLWAPIAVLTRFFMVVLIEPGYNPLKAPVSYLAAKVMAPLIGWLLFVWTPDTVNPWPLPLRLLGYAIFWPTFFHLADVFGYLFWEMKENWALYRSNRGQLIRPAGVGGHNETIRGLLSPGFHSGTIPRLYTRLRNAEKLAIKTLNWNPARTYRHELEEVAHAVERFLSREMVALLLQHPLWRGKQIEVGPVHLATNRIRLELLHHDHPARPVEIEIAYNAGWLLGGIRSVGWLDTLDLIHKRVFAVCLAYLYRRSDVDLVREQVLDEVDLHVSSLQMTYEGIIVWKEGEEKPHVFDLRDAFDDPAREEEVRRVAFGQTRIGWVAWMEAWQEGGGSRASNEVVELADRLIRLSGRSAVADSIDGPSLEISSARALPSVDGELSANAAIQPTAEGS